MVRCRRMAERDRSPDGVPPQPVSQADRTLLGVAPPRIESTPDSALRSPVFVRSGTSVADVAPPPVPRMALPSRPPPPVGGSSDPLSALSSSSASIAETGARRGLEPYLRVARAHPVL